MKITLESTTKMVQFVRAENGERVAMPARLWEGTTDTGIPVHAFITRIAPTIENPPDEIKDQFARELVECVAPTAGTTAYRWRMFLP
jgi:hypothetical protein